MIDSFGVSDIGRRRKLNEDNVLVDDDLGLFVVADGMGGHNAGEVASSLAVEVVSNFIRRSREEEEITWPYGIDPKISLNGNRLRTAVMLANKRVWKEADNREEYTGMGTTLVAALVASEEVVLCNAGDSRAYRLRDAKLEQVTTDDSWVQAAFSEGVLQPQEIQYHPMRNIITKAIGAREAIEVNILEEGLQSGDIYLLCSDGLHGMVNDQDIERIMVSAEGDLEKAVRALIEAANAGGGKDNISAVIFRYRS
jgi:serine/threonine protein phosphatase PrpC